MKHLQSYNESINLDTAYDYEYHSTEEGDVDGDKFTTYYYTFTGKDKEKYYVSLSYFDYNLGSFTADFQDEKTFLKDREEGKDFLTYTYINTNKFDAFKVITTVFKIIKDFYEHNIETLDGFNFNCEDDKRHNIYKHIISKLFPTWKLTKDEKDSDGTWDLTYDFGDALTESLRDKMTGVEMIGDKKVIFDASKDCESIRLRPTDFFSHNGVYSFNITNHTHRSEDVDIDIDYYTDKSKGSEYRWIITINGAGIKEEVKSNTWGEALIGLIDILFPNIEKQIETAKSTLNMYKKSDQNLADSWVQKYELKILPRLRKILELRTKYSEKTNESLRDKMTPKSEEEIDSAFKNLVKDSTPLSEYLHLETEEFKEISRLTGKPLDKLYYVDDEESAHFVMLHDHFASFLDSIPGSELGNPIEVKNNKYKNHYGKWYCYPQFDLAYWYQDDGIVGWVFSEDTFKNN